jgi:hypothetical protein
MWYSKGQNTVESATFGLEFIALKTAIDQIDALRYKLRMFGIPLVVLQVSSVTMKQSPLMQRNPADILTKLLPGPKMRALLRCLFYWNRNPPDGG